MPYSALLLRAMPLLPLLIAGVRGGDALPAEIVSLATIASFIPPTPNWQLVSALTGDPRTDRLLIAASGTGLLVCNPSEGARGHLVTAWEHGDIEVELEFLLPPGSNSGVYLQGRYEVQLFDSWGVRNPTAQDCGGVYPSKPADPGAAIETFPGAAPRANAARAPGLWQRLRIEFQAPRFDANGRKTRNARFSRVLLNGFLVQENLEVPGPTRAAAFTDEKPLGPLLVQGDHGPVALRNLAVKRFGPERVTVENLHYRLHRGEFKRIEDYDRRPPEREGTPARFSHHAIEKSGRFAVVFTGRMRVPQPGLYHFAIQSTGVAQLLVNGEAVVSSLDRGSQPGVVRLDAGAHDFRVNWDHAVAGAPAFVLQVEGPGMPPHALTSEEQTPTLPTEPKKLLVDVGNRVQVQRGFVPFAPVKRLYAAAVGTPEGVHYAYDFETGALLRAWRGSFIDAAGMWEGRGYGQLAEPAGPGLVLNGKPVVALIANARHDDWPAGPDPLWSSRGYQLERDGEPVFLSTLAELDIRDRIAPASDGRGLARRLEFQGQLPSWSAWVLLAEASHIAPQPGGRGWIIGDREWYLDWPEDSAHRPVVRTFPGRQQLAVPLTAATLEQPLHYTHVW